MKKRKARWVACVGCVLLVATESPRIQAQTRTVKTPAGTQSAVTTSESRVLDAYGKMPLSFEPNRGQTDPRVKFLSRGPGYTLFMTSNEAVATYTLQAATPTFAPPGGSYLLPKRVSISGASPGTTIDYTTDGTTPTTSSSRYTGPILVLSTKTIKAIAVAPGWSQSPIANATYRMLVPRLP